MPFALPLGSATLFTPSSVVNECGRNRQFLSIFPPHLFLQKCISVFDDLPECQAEHFLQQVDNNKKTYRAIRVGRVLSRRAI